MKVPYLGWPTDFLVVGISSCRNRGRWPNSGKTMSDSVFQLECWFTGRVQGVGFRVQTLGVARGFEVTGTVKNLVDGRVYLAAEGDEAEVRAFLEELQSEMEHYIRDTEVRTNSGTRAHRGFTISH